MSTRKAGRRVADQVEKVNHPQHYGGADNPHEAIKCITTNDLKFARGNAVKYILRAGKKPGEDELDDLLKARWYLDWEIAMLRQTGPKKEG